MLQLPLLYPGTLSSLGVSCPRGVLLVGPPGVGKTLLVHTVAGEVGASLVVVRGPEVEMIFITAFHLCVNITFLMGTRIQNPLQVPLFELNIRQFT